MCIIAYPTPSFFGHERIYIFNDANYQRNIKYKQSDDLPLNEWLSLKKCVSLCNDADYV